MGLQIGDFNGSAKSQRFVGFNDLSVLKLRGASIKSAQLATP